MRSFTEHNPIAVSLYLLNLAGIAMLCMDPVILTLSLLGGVILFIILNGAIKAKTHLYFLFLFIFMALINPIFSHNGVTVLFVINDTPVTLEALFYGIAASAMIIAVLYWFRVFSQIITSDRLLYIFGALSPRLALILSAAIRFIPLFTSQLKKVNAAQRALGIYKEDNIIDNIRGGARVFSITVTWALENGIITADSMSARGYGIGKRSHYSLFCFKASDAILIMLSITLFVLTLVGSYTAEFVYYPAILMPRMTPMLLIGYAAYGALVILPIILETKEALRWKYLRSRI